MGRPTMLLDDLSNYDTWKEEMELELIGAGLDVDSIVKDEKKDSRRKLAKGKLILIRNMSKVTRCSVQSLDDTAQIFDKLKPKMTRTVKYEIQKEYMMMHQADMNMRNYLNELERLWARKVTGGLHATYDELCMKAVMGTAPQHVEFARLQLDRLPEGETNQNHYQKLRSELIEHERIDNAIGGKSIEGQENAHYSTHKQKPRFTPTADNPCRACGATTTPGASGQTSSRRFTGTRFTGTCNHCGIVGHKKAQCRKLKKEQAEKMENHTTHRMIRMRTSTMCGKSTDGGRKCIKTHTRTRMKMHMLLLTRHWPHKWTGTPEDGSLTLGPRPL